MQRNFVHVMLVTLFRTIETPEKISVVKGFTRYLLVFLWIVVVLHEVIPHYHPNGEHSRIDILPISTTSEPFNGSDEDGALDNLTVLYPKRQHLLNPSIQKVYHLTILGCIPELSEQPEQNFPLSFSSGMRGYALLFPDIGENNDVRGPPVC